MNDLSKEVLPPAHTPFQKGLRAGLQGLVLLVLIFVLAASSARGLDAYVAWAAETEAETPVLDIQVAEPFPEARVEPSAWSWRSPGDPDAVGHWTTCTREAPCRMQQFVSAETLEGSLFDLLVHEDVFIRSCKQKGCLDQSRLVKHGTFPRFQMGNGRWRWIGRAK